MADLVLSVDVSSLANARSKLDGFQKAMNNLSVNRLASGVNSLQNSIRQLVEAQAKGTIGSNAYQKGLLELKRAYEQLGYSSQQATAAVRAYATQLQRQRAAQEAARAAEELARAQQQAAERTRQLRLRFQEGYAAFDRARKQMRDLREALRQGIITTDQYREAVRRLREEQQRAGAGAGDLARRMNRQGVITQQAGYQLGDFIVQVQSGTNWMVAFGQQATQVAGTLTLLGGKWILIGSVLGVVIPLITAVGAAFMRTRNAAEETSDGIQSLSDRVQSARRAISDLAFEVDALRRGFEDLNEFALILQIEESTRLIKELESRLEGLNERQIARGGLGGVLARLEAERETLELTQEQLERLRELRGEHSRLNGEALQYRDVVEGLQEPLQFLLGMAREIGDEFKDTQANALAQFEQKMQEAAEEARQAAQEARELKEEMAEAKREAELLAAVDMKSGIDGAADAAARLADNLAFAASLSPEVNAAMVRSGVASGAIPPQALQDLPQTDAERVYQDMLERRRRASRQAQSGGRSGGGGGTPEFVSRVFGPELQQAIEQAQEDLRSYNQEVQMLDSALQAGLITQQEYNSFVAQAQEVYNQAQQGAYDYQKALEQVEKTAMSSMENAFMSLIDGSKSASEAFRDMAREILAEAMRMMVIRPLIQSIFGGGGGGGIFSIFGGVTGTKASGGTMMAGEPYLVGERGPELVIPSRSGTVMNADLTNKAMAGGNQKVQVEVFVNDNGNFDARVREVSSSVVAKAAPRIIQGAERQILDQRRRGGVMKATF